MSMGILGRKIGMTQVFDEEGRAVPVTVVEAGPCPVLAVRTQEKNGYTAVVLAFGEKGQERGQADEGGLRKGRCRAKALDSGVPYR